MAHVVLADRLRAAGLGDRVVVTSGGTGGWHVGDGADPRAVAVLAERGLDGSHHRVRQVDRDWLRESDLIVVADQSHLTDLRRTLRGDPDVIARVHLLREWDAAQQLDPVALDVPDPYYGSISDFREVADMVQRSCEGLVAELVVQLGTIAQALPST